MTVNAIGGTLLTALSALNGRTLSTLSTINGQAISAAPATPSSIANIWEWWEPEREGLANNDPITTLTGQVAPGSGRNFTQATSARRPTFLTNQINGLGAAHFVAADTKFMVGVDASALAAAHVFIIVQIPTDPPATAQTPWSIGSDYVNPDLYPFTTGSIYSGIATGTRKNAIANPTPSLAAWRVFEVVSIGGTWTAMLDGVQIFTVASNIVHLSEDCRLGDMDPRGGSSIPWDGDIAGAYIFSAQKTGADRAAMVTYINARFGLSMS